MSRFFAICLPLKGPLMLMQSYRGFSLLEFNSDFVVVNKAPGIGMHDEEGEPGLVLSLIHI